MLGEHFLALDKSQQEAVESLFAICFGTIPEKEWFFWKYAANPRHDGIAIGLCHSGRLFAHYAGFPRDLQLPSNSPGVGPDLIGALQIGDVMVDPSARRGIARNNLFARLTSQFFSRYLNDHRPLAFGFPNQRHLKQGIMAGLYVSIGSIQEVEWSLHRTEASHQEPLALPGPTFECAPGSVDQHHFNHLANLAASSRKQWAIVRRNLSYWQWRFPENRGYRWIQSDGGFAVIRQVDDRGLEWYLVDWLCLAAGAEALLACCLQAVILVHQANADALDQDPIRLKTWASSPCADELTGICMPKIDGVELRVRSQITDVELALSCYPRNDYQDLIRDRFWVISGDTDFL